MDGLTHVLTDIQYSTNVVISLGGILHKRPTFISMQFSNNSFQLVLMPQLNICSLKIKLWLPNLIIALSLLFAL